MKVTEDQFQRYLNAAPPVIWMWIYGELQEGEAKSAFHKFAFDETEHLRDLTPPRMHAEFTDLISKFPEVEVVTRRAASDFYIRNSWRKWLPWNWAR